MLVSEGIGLPMGWKTQRFWLKYSGFCREAAFWAEKQRLV
jgi:hypothetical protein